MKDMKTRTNQDKIVSVMRSSRGRYFGLTTTQGNQVNARFINETPHYVRVYASYHSKFNQKRVATKIQQ